jgi:hypothetical protein
MKKVLSLRLHHKTILNGAKGMRQKGLCIFMGYHGFRDSAYCAWNGFKRSLSGSLFFSESVESPTLIELYQGFAVTVPPIVSEGEFPVVVTGRDDLRPIVHVLRWLGDGYPAVIYHHISNEYPIDGSCRKILLSAKNPLHANVVLVQAAYHETSAAFNKCVRGLSSFAAMVALSARVIDECVAQLSERKMKTVVAGMKLGGWVANFHHAVSNSASAYVPALAGAGFGDIFVDSSFNKCVSSRALREHGRVRRALNFDDLFMARAGHPNVYPILAEYDRISDYYRQSTCYGDHRIAVLSKGHITGARAFDVLRSQIDMALGGKRR